MYIQVGLVVSTAIAKTLQWPVQTLSQMYGSSVFTGIYIKHYINTYAYIYNIYTHIHSIIRLEYIYECLCYVYVYYIYLF